MGAKWNKWDWDYLWHVLGGYVITMIVLIVVIFTQGHQWIPFLMIPILTIGGVVREKIQHDWERLTAHQWLEGILWGVGALFAALVGSALPI